jgi:hypothetical protein
MLKTDITLDLDTHVLPNMPADTALLLLTMHYAPP